MKIRLSTVNYYHNCCTKILNVYVVFFRIKRAVTLINNLGSSKFPLLLTRILQKLHLIDERTFSEEEEEKLQGSLELAGPDLELVLQSLEFFLQQVTAMRILGGTFSLDF